LKTYNFKIGDRVRVFSEHNDENGCIGIIEDIHEKDPFPISVYIKSLNKKITYRLNGDEFGIEDGNYIRKDMSNLFDEDI